MHSGHKSSKRLLSGILSAAMLAYFCTVMPITAFADDDTGASVKYSYDKNYNLISTINASGNETKYEYDKIGRNTAIIDALGNRTEFTYNSHSQLGSMTDAKGNTYTYSYDDNGNRISTEFPDHSTVSTTYDARGRVTSQTDQNGYTTDVIDRGWVAAGDFSEGDEIYLIDGSTAFITGAELEKLAEPIKVYNLEVADFNTYFVGDEAILVHNYPASDGEGIPTSVNSGNSKGSDTSVPPPTDNHSSQTGRSLPAKNGPSNGSMDLFNDDGDLVQRRFFDELGNALLDIDFIHSNGDGTHEFPHFHDWDWSQTPPRSKWRK